MVDDAIENDDEFDWESWWRVPAGLPEVATLPPPAAGELYLVHHVDGRTVARFSPRHGRAEPFARLAEQAVRGDGSVAGRYLPVRSGVLAYYRGEDGNRVVQHRRRRMILPDGARAELRGLWAVRRLTFLHGDRRLGGLTVIDAPARWQGPLFLRLFDFTWILPEDWDLLEGIVDDLDGSGSDLV